METKGKKKKVFGLRIRLNDDQEWSPIRWFKSEKARDREASMNRILGGIRTHSFYEYKTISEIEEIDFD